MVANKTEPPITKNYLTIVALEDGLTAKLSVNACEYCVDGDGVWRTLPANSLTENINAGQTLSFRGNLTPTSSVGVGTFYVTKSFKLKGTPMSLLFGDDGKSNFSLKGKSHAFYKLFEGCSNLISASEFNLSALILDIHSYSYMFYLCTNLIHSPLLPAKNLAEYCYNGMFKGCKKITDIYYLELPAISLPNFVYVSMFEDCISLTNTPKLPATELSTACYQQMFKNCTGLTSAPELPATKLTAACYRNMFNGCSKLNYIKMMATDISGSNCLYDWVSGIASSGTFVKNKNANFLNFFAKTY